MSNTMSKETYTHVKQDVKRAHKNKNSLVKRAQSNAMSNTMSKEIARRSIHVLKKTYTRVRRDDKRAYKRSIHASKEIAKRSIHVFERSLHMSCEPFLEKRRKCTSKEASKEFWKRDFESKGLHTYPYNKRDRKRDVNTYHTSPLLGKERYTHVKKDLKRVVE